MEERNAERKRWEMSRAGLLNFWCYEDEEFTLESGRLVLRGTNGAGKSVTMQSFLPLVLDGDKRPHRLDPFGSRDRKIEYYLLGDGENERRTAYIWLEFYHPVKGLHKTIGIGLRAQKGAAQVQFWGFVLEDGRRVNRDFWLYDRTAFLSGEGKFPLDRRGLIERIGAGGQVVQEQGAYRDLVNKSLFGYYDIDAFGDLLQLLIQLRSPKLSKDFRPSAIYEILRQALPPIHEDDLRPLSEVLEDMDQMADRLEELQLHKSELEKLEKAYDRYNRYRLYRAAERFAGSKREAERLQKAVDDEDAAWRNAEERRSGLEEERRQVGREREAAQAELDLLARHEAIEKQKELGDLEKNSVETERYVQASRGRLKLFTERRAQAEKNRDEADRAMAEANEAQRGALEELEGLARDIEFAEHDVYHRYWGAEPPADDRFLAPWKRDLAAHAGALREALQVAEQEQKEEMRAQDAEKELGELRLERDKADRERIVADRAAETELAGWKEELVRWKQGLAALPVPEEAFAAMLRAASELAFEHRDFDAVRKPAWEAAERWKRERMNEEADLLLQLKEARVQEAKLLEEKEQWERAGEPEPSRSEARSRTRARRQAGQGAALFEACDFLSHITDADRARIEETLAVAGLLDAWIQPGGAVFRLYEDEADGWFVPQPLEWGYTLADVLKPVAPEESGLTNADIDAVLRSFAWDENGEAWAQPGLAAGDAAVVSLDAYRVGPVSGKTSAREPARYIGKEARRRYKLAELARLQRELEEMRAVISERSAAVEEIRTLMTKVDAEKNAFPEAATLQEAWNRQRETLYRLEALLAQEKRMADALKVKYDRWQELRRQLAERTVAWSRLKRWTDLRVAEQQAQAYQALIGELVSDWRQYKQAEERKSSALAALAEMRDSIGSEQDQLDDLEDKLRGLRMRIDSLLRVIEDLGIRDVHEKIRSLEMKLQSLVERDGELEKELMKHSRLLGGLEAELRSGKERLAEQQALVRETLARWQEEVSHNLVPEWAEAAGRASGDETALLRVCRDILQQGEAALGKLQSESVSGHVLDQYNAVKHLLMDYVLEAEVLETSGRIFVVSLRDRHQPQTPASLLKELGELVEEQSMLLDEKDRELFEEIILRSVGKTIRQRIQRAEQWVGEMNRLMSERDTSSGLKLQLDWVAKPGQSEQELDSDQLVALLRRDSHLLEEEQVEQLIRHFRSRIQLAKTKSQEERESLRKYIYEMLDYRDWFQFVLRSKKGSDAGYRDLTDARFNTMSGGEKAMSMYIPLFAATYSRYADAHPEAPKLISLDEAFAGVDEENIRDLFALLTDMDFDYMMTSQVLWGCYDTVPKLSISEIYRPKDANFVTVFRYRWNGRRKELVEPGSET